MGPAASAVELELVAAVYVASECGEVLGQPTQLRMCGVVWLRCRLLDMGTVLGSAISERWNRSILRCAGLVSVSARGRRSQGSLHFAGKRPAISKLESVAGLRPSEAC